MKYAAGIVMGRFGEEMSQRAIFGLYATVMDCVLLQTIAQLKLSFMLSGRANIRRLGNTKTGLLDIEGGEDFQNGLQWTVVSCMGIARHLEKKSR